MQSFADFSFGDGAFTNDGPFAAVDANDRGGESGAGVTAIEDEWKADYALPLKGVLPSPWMIAVALENTSLQKLLEDTTKDWMKTGFIVEAEKKWGITPTEYSLFMHEQYKDK